jgi:hypothetical protein
MWTQFHLSQDVEGKIKHTHTYMGFFVASIWLNLDILFVSLTFKNIDSTKCTLHHYDQVNSKCQTC